MSGQSVDGRSWPDGTPCDVSRVQSVDACPGSWPGPWSSCPSVAAEQAARALAALRARGPLVVGTPWHAGMAASGPRTADRAPAGPGAPGPAPDVDHGPQDGPAGRPWPEPTRRAHRGPELADVYGPAADPGPRSPADPHAVPSAQVEPGTDRPTDVDRWDAMRARQATRSVRGRAHLDGPTAAAGPVRARGVIDPLDVLADRAHQAHQAAPEGPRQAPQQAPQEAPQDRPRVRLTWTGPGALQATHRPPSADQRARLAEEAARAAAARARAELAAHVDQVADQTTDHEPHEGPQQPPTRCPACPLPPLPPPCPACLPAGAPRSPQEPAPGPLTPGRPHQAAHEAHSGPQAPGHATPGPQDDQEGPQTTPQTSPSEPLTSTNTPTPPHIGRTFPDLGPGAGERPASIEGGSGAKVLRATRAWIAPVGTAPPSIPPGFPVSTEPDPWSEGGRPWQDVGFVHVDTWSPRLCEFGAENEPDGLRPWTPSPGGLTGRTMTVEFTLREGTAAWALMRAAIREHEAAHVARSRERSRNALRAMRRRAAQVRRAAARPTRYQWARDGMKPRGEW